jgi:serine/threonine-protein kinase RsbW
MASSATWIIESDLGAMAPVAQAVRELALPVIGDEGAGDLELAIVEAISNVIRHGYGPAGGPVKVEAEAVPGDGVTIRVHDWGRPIPGDALAGAGLSRFDFDPDDLDAIPSGGMGLSLITAVMDDVAYRSDEGQNVLTLRRGLRD